MSEMKVEVKQSESREMRLFQTNNVTLAPGTPVNAGVLDMLDYLAEKMVYSGWLPNGLVAWEGKGHNKVMDLKKTRSNVFLAAYSLYSRGADPVANIGNMSVVNGRPDAWGDLLSSFIRRCDGFYDMGYEYHNEGDLEKMSCTCYGKRVLYPPPNSGLKVEIKTVSATFSMALAEREGLLGGKIVRFKDDNGQWKEFPSKAKETWESHPEDMLLRRATRKMAKQLFPEALSGLPGYEVPESDIEHDVIDTIPVETAVVPMVQSSAAAVAALASAKKINEKASRKPDVVDVEPIPCDAPPPVEELNLAPPEDVPDDGYDHGDEPVHEDDLPAPKTLPLDVSPVQIEKDYKSRIAGCRSRAELKNLIDEVESDGRVDAESHQNLLSVGRAKYTELGKRDNHK